MTARLQPNTQSAVVAPRAAHVDGATPPGFAGVLVEVAVGAQVATHTLVREAVDSLRNCWNPGAHALTCVLLGFTRWVLAALPAGAHTKTLVGAR